MNQFWTALLAVLLLTQAVLGAGTYIKGPALIEGTTSTVTSGGTLTLTKDSESLQRFTGATTHTVTLPNGTTIPLGRKIYLFNESTGTVTVNYFGGALATTLPAGNWLIATLYVSSSAGTWNFASSPGGTSTAITALTGDVVATGPGSVGAVIPSGTINNTRMANVPTSSFKGRITAGTGVPEDLTGTQATTLLDVFTSGLKGLAPASGGGTTNFLRADGTWAPPGAASGFTIGSFVIGGTANRVVYEDASNQIAEDPDLQFDGDSLTLGKETIHAQITTPSNPSAGYNKLYFKSDDKLYKKTSAGVETEIGSGGGVVYPLLAPDGSLSAPSYSFTSASNAGIFMSSNQINLVGKSFNAGNNQGGAVLIQGGEGFGIAEGGYVTMAGGDGNANLTTGGPGGQVLIRGGDGLTHEVWGGNVTIRGGNAGTGGSSNNGGSVDIATGSHFGGGGQPEEIRIKLTNPKNNLYVRGSGDETLLRFRPNTTIADAYGWYLEHHLSAGSQPNIYSFGREGGSGSFVSTFEAGFLTSLGVGFPTAPTDNPNYQIEIQGQGGDSLVQFVNTASGITAADGLLVGLRFNGDAEVNHQDSSSLFIKQNGTDMIRFNSIPQFMTHVISDTGNQALGRDSSNPYPFLAVYGSQFGVGFPFGVGSPTINYSLDLRATAAATAVYSQYTIPTTTGTGSADGFLVGLDASGNSVLNNQELGKSFLIQSSGVTVYSQTGVNVTIGDEAIASTTTFEGDNSQDRTVRITTPNAFTGNDIGTGNLALKLSATNDTTNRWGIYWENISGVDYGGISLRQQATGGGSETGEFRISPKVSGTIATRLRVNNNVLPQGTGIGLGYELGDEPADIPVTTIKAEDAETIVLETVDAGIDLNTSGTKPTCNSSVRGQMFFEEGGAGVPDELYMCMKDTADAYAWELVHAAP